MLLKIKLKLDKILNWLDQYNEKSKLYRLRHLYINLLLIIIASRFEHDNKLLIDFGFLFLGLICLLYLVKNRNKIIKSSLKLGANLFVLFILFFTLNISIFLYESRTERKNNFKIEKSGNDYHSLNLLDLLNKEANLNKSKGFYFYLKHNFAHDNFFNAALIKGINDIYLVSDLLKPAAEHEYNKYLRTKSLKIGHRKDLEEVGKLYENYIGRENTSYSEIFYLEDKFEEYINLYKKFRKERDLKNKHKKIIIEYIKKVLKRGGKVNQKLLIKFNDINEDKL